MIFLIFSQLMRHPLIKLFQLSYLLQMPNNHRMVNVEFLGNFSYRIGFDDVLSWLLSPSSGWPLHSSSSRPSSPLQNFLNHHYAEHSLAVPGPNVLLMLIVISTNLQPILNLNKKSNCMCFLSNIISRV